MYGPQLKAAVKPLAALDCGAGIGRISEQLLLHLFDEVDLVEPSRHLLETARRRLCSGSKQCDARLKSYPVCSAVILASLSVCGLQAVPQRSQGDRLLSDGSTGLHAGSPEVQSACDNTEMP